MTTTQEILTGMLTENVGSHFLDSGGTPRFDDNGNYAGSSNGYGRAFERNQGIDFNKAQTTVVSFSLHGGKLDISMVHHVYHWLDQRVEIEETLDSIFHGAFRKAVDHYDPPLVLGRPDPHYHKTEKTWLELMDEFPQWVAEHVTTEGNVRQSQFNAYDQPAMPKKPGFVRTRKARKLARAKFAKQMAKYEAARDEFNRQYEQFGEDEFCEVGGIYGDGGPFTENTYNSDNLLSQDLQYTFFHWNNEDYVVLQIHGGADIRGGYTKPRVFRCTEEEGLVFAGHGSIGCTGKDHHPSALRMKEFYEAQCSLPGMRGFIAIPDFDNCRAYWSTDDSCHFYDQGCCGRDYVNLEDMPAVDLEAELAAAEDEEPSDDVAAQLARPGNWRPGVVCVQDGKAYCPHCGALLAGGY